ncbi:MAG: hypothetical protein K2K12_03860 [Clostridia bacterium]|nr:hypothetical protein [Clostridia bacterium]
MSFCAERLSEEDEKEIESFLKDEFGVDAEIQVKRKTDAKFSYQKISVKIFDFGIIGQDEHIDTMSRIQETLQAKYGCLTEVA